MASGDAKGTGSRVQTVCRLLVRHGWHSKDAVRDIYRKWKTEPHVHDENASQFLRWLVNQQYVTEDQAGKLAGGTKPTPVPDKPAETVEWDVELVKALPMENIVISIGRLQLSRRDLLMLGFGAAAVTLVGLVSVVIGRR